MLGVHDASANAGSYVRHVPRLTDRSPRNARHWAQPFLADRPAIADTALLALCELLTNARRYAEGPARVRLIADDEHLEIRVADRRKDGIPPEIGPVDWEAETGRGLSILAELGVLEVFPGAGAWGKEVAFIMMIGVTDA